MNIMEDITINVVMIAGILTLTAGYAKGGTLAAVGVTLGIITLSLPVVGGSRDITDKGIICECGNFTTISLFNLFTTIFIYNL